MTKYAERVLFKENQWAVPLLWRSEFANVLVTCIRQKMFSEKVGHLMFDKALQLMHEKEYSVPNQEVLSQALTRGLSAHDAEFAVLAKQLGVPLITSDTKVLKACSDIAVHPKHFA